MMVDRLRSPHRSLHLGRYFNHSSEAKKSECWLTLTSAATTKKNRLHSCTFVSIFLQIIENDQTIVSDQKRMPAVNYFLPVFARSFECVAEKWCSSLFLLCLASKYHSGVVAQPSITAVGCLLVDISATRTIRSMYSYHRLDWSADPWILFSMTDLFSSSLADRRGLIHFLRSSHSSASETTSRSRRTSRSVTSDSRHSVDLLIEERDQTQNVEHRRVIDSFVVRSSF